VLETENRACAGARTARWRVFHVKPRINAALRIEHVQLRRRSRCVWEGGGSGRPRSAEVMHGHGSDSVSVPAAGSVSVSVAGPDGARHVGKLSLPAATDGEGLLRAFHVKPRIDAGRPGDRRRPVRRRSRCVWKRGGSGRPRTDEAMHRRGAIEFQCLRRDRSRCQWPARLTRGTSGTLSLTAATDGEGLLRVLHVKPRVDAGRLVYRTRPLAAAFGPGSRG